jgi:hypothetical protein
VGLGPTVLVTELRTDMDAVALAMKNAKTAGRVDHDIPLRLASLAEGAAILTRSVAWTQQDNQEVRGIFLHVTDGTASRVVTARLTQDDGGTRFLGDRDWEVSVTTIVGAARGFLDVRDDEGPRLRLIKGVRYRLEIENESAGTTVTGPLHAAVQVRTVRRGGAMDIPILPNGFRVSGNLDLEKLNDNFAAMQDGLNDGMDMRYTHSTSFFDLSGITDTDALVLRQLAFRPPTAGRETTLLGVELVLTNATAATVWTLSKTGDSLWPEISATAADAAEVTASRFRDVLFDDSAADVKFTLAPSTATGVNTIARGYIVLHWRCDRWAQGTALDRFDFAPYSSTSSTSSVTLENVNQDAQTVADYSVDTADDLRPAVFVARNLAPAGSAVFRIPAGAMTRDMRVTIYVVAAGTVTARVTVDDADGTPVVTDVVGAGVAALAVGGADLSEGGLTDPTSGAADVIITLAHQAGAANVLLVYAVVWFR